MEDSTQSKNAGSVVDLSELGKTSSPRKPPAVTTTTREATEPADASDLTDARAAGHNRKASQGGTLAGEGRSSSPQPIRGPSSSPERSKYSSSSANPQSPQPRSANSGTGPHPIRRQQSYQVRTQADNRYLSSPHYAGFKKFASVERCPLSDRATWQAILAGERLPQPQTSQEAFDLEMLTIQIGESFTKNNLDTGNFNTLLLYLLSHMRYMRIQAYDGDWATEAYNALFLVRLFVKYSVDNLMQLQIHQQFEMDRTLSITVQSAQSFKLDSEQMFVDSHVLNDKRLRAQQLLEELLHVIIYADARTAINYDFYMEAMNLLLTMASSQLHQQPSNATEGSYFLEILLDRLSHFAGGAMQRLLMNFIHRTPPIGSPGGGMLYSAYSYLFTPKKSDRAAPSPLGDKSAILFLILANQNPKRIANEYKEAIKRLKDSNVSESVSSMVEDENGINVSFRQVYQALCSNMAAGETSLILYSLLVHNQSFRSFIFSRTDSESLMLPILKQVNELVEHPESFPQLYIMLIVVLLLTQDDVFVDSIQKITIQAQSWYTERIIKSVSVGGLAVLVIIRCIQANLATFKDSYCHLLCLGILANMSRNIVGMNSIVAQRIVSFYDMVTRRYLKLTGQLAHESTDTIASPIEPDNADMDIDTAIYGDLVGLVLEMINSILTHTLKHNPELIYALLHKRDSFIQFRMHSRYIDLVENIDKVMSYFHAKLLEADLKMPSTADVADVIDRATKTWSPSKLKIFSTLRFQYEEDTFFLPYVWSFAVNMDSVYWDRTKTRLVNEFDVSSDYGVEDNDK